MKQLKPILIPADKSIIVYDASHSKLRIAVQEYPYNEILGCLTQNIILIDPKTKPVEGDYILNPEENVIEIFAKNKQNISKYPYYKIIGGLN